MNFQRILVIIDKESTQTFKSWSSWSTICFPPMLLTSLLLIFVYTVAKAKIPISLEIAMNYFVMVFAVMTTPSATRLAAVGIAADKAALSLEPLLTTPLTAMEFIFGKIVVAATVPILTTLAVYGVFVSYTHRWGIAQTSLFGDSGGPLCLCVFVTTTVLWTVFLTLRALGIASRKADPRDAISAATSSGLFDSLFPMVAVYYAQRHQIEGIKFLFMAGGLLILLNLVQLFFSIRLFQRETILFKWK
jgi:ABC-type Na+ efflux pump permease subunit